MIRKVIFDLDLTLVDTSALEVYRDRNDWKSTYANMNKCSMYKGMRKVLNVLEFSNVEICIVSTSPSSYVKKIVEYFKVPADHIVGYHDAKPIKPAPEPMLKALSLMECNASDVLSFGDRAIDIQASRSAGIVSVACLWGTKEKDSLLSTSPNFILETPAQILELCRAY